MSRPGCLGVLAVFILAVVSCGHHAPLPPASSDAGSGADGSTTGADAAADGPGMDASALAHDSGTPGDIDGAVSRRVCPSQMPPNGAACADNGLTCGFGDDVRGQAFRAVAVCVSSAWQVKTPDPTACPPLRNDGACLADLSGACDQDAICSKANGDVCRCTRCPPTAPLCQPSPQWYCAAPVTTAGCPATPPNLGTPCDVAGVMCAYLQECGQPVKVCSDGVWTPGQVLGCPVSTRRVKKDIRYLSTSEVAATAAEALKLRLATYEYKGAPYSGRRHLGFIIEDSPNAPAVDRDGDLVDLYGYSSMLLATAQAQEREIQRLEELVRLLKASLEQLSSRRSRSSPARARSHF
jgi:hypothetical protein